MFSCWQLLSSLLLRFLLPHIWTSRRKSLGAPSFTAGGRIYPHRSVCMWEPSPRPYFPITVKARPVSFGCSLKSYCSPSGYKHVNSKLFHSLLMCVASSFLMLEPDFGWKSCYLCRESWHLDFILKLFIYLTMPGLSYGIWDLLPWRGVELRPPALGAWSLSHWTTKEVPGDF